MAEKLTAAAWSSFVKKRELDDGAFVKALGKLESTDEDKHDARLAALEEVVSQGNKLVVALARKKPPLPEKEQREVKDKLHAFIETAERAQKEVRSAKAQADAGDEEADSPALLTTKMVPLVRDLRKGEAKMFALIALAGKETVVLISRRSISPARGKLLKEQMTNPSGLKFIRAECLFEQNALTFVVQAPAAGLAKKLKAALLAQIEMRLKVRVRGEDGVEDQDGDDEDEGEEAESTDTVGSDPQPKVASPAELAWKERWPKVRAAAMQALQQGQHPDASRLRAVLAFANEKGEVDGDHATGLKALDTLAQLLKAEPTTTTPPPTAPGPERKTVAPTIVYTQTRLAWVATRGKVKAELAKLEKSILDHYKQHERLPDVVRSVRKLDGVLEMFDESLTDQLDNALNAADAEEKARWHGEARKVIEKYQGYLASDPFVKELDANPFVPVSVRATLETTLKTLASKIA